MDFTPKVRWSFCQPGSVIQHGTPYCPTLRETPTAAVFKTEMDLTPTVGWLFQQPRSAIESGISHRSMLTKACMHTPQLRWERKIEASFINNESNTSYAPLQMYQELGLNEDQIYRQLEHHILTAEQLKLYGFPTESPDRPGHVTVSKNLVTGSSERHCCRCGSPFKIYSNGYYGAQTNCKYHPKKNAIYSGIYACCNGDYLSKGCVTHPFHVTVESCLHGNEFVRAKEEIHLNEVNSRTVYAVDCEMVYTTAGMEVAKVAIVGVNGLTVYESYVLPESKILDYNTLYSGVTKEDLNGVTITLRDVQTYLQQLFNKNSILIGHSLEGDLKALRFVHEKVVDTSVVFPHPYGETYKKSLKALAKEFLQTDIQQSENTHDPFEDARTCMDLMLRRISTNSQNRLPRSQDENHNTIL